MLKRVPAIYRKEMLDLLRDRRAILSMVVVPIAVMPLLFFVLGKVINRAESKASAKAGTVAVRNLEAVPGLLNALAWHKFDIRPKEDLKAAVRNKEVAAAIEPVQAGGGLIIRIYTDDSRQESEMAGEKLQSALNLFRDNSVKLRLRMMNVPENVLSPFDVKRENVAPKQKMAGLVWGGTLAYVVVLLMFSGGMYPAIDLTAGEKERRTLEVVLSSPAGREEIILGKLLATTTAVFCTALLSVSSLMFSFRYADFGKESRKLHEMIGGLPADPRTMGLVLAALLPTAIMGASLMIAIALFAKSFKEAQSYLTPFLSLVIFPLIIGMMPGMQLTPTLAAIPLFNVCQEVKEIFQGEWKPLEFGIVMASNTVYAAVSFFAAVRIFKSEDVLFRT